MPKIIYFVTEDWYFWSHRLSLARAAQKSGFQVTVLTRVNKYKDLIESEGFNLIPLELVRSSKNIFVELLCFLEIIKIFRREKPDIVHNVALKPILYGTWAARFSRVPCVVNLFAGITTKFHAKKWKSIILGTLVDLVFRFGFWNNNAYAIFQNSFDRKAFLDKNLLLEENTGIICGSGVSLTKFIDTPEPDGSPLVILASRMLWDKGVGEFVEAAKILKNEKISCRMILVGNPDPENPVPLPKDLILKWQSEGWIEWWEHREDMPEVFSGANIVCLPSYHEGCPKVLIEAAACGRALVATDIPGCRTIVRHDENGLLVPVKNVTALADAIKFLVQSPKIRMQMGKRSREITVENFSEEKVIKETLDAYNMLLEKRNV
ncbi:MAG: glycosyltransferase family 4 protein [Nitrospina sp.]|jgi:glycosyltransferase involved in cell wall biosynthesis|nr:glycosyltransferase family 4 protein [Nitrospina sp.]MBT3511151.1 glycosyltransferase family 4 protein [Nitrospina sp.]MBT3876046.1 glycosyltransferase family 4 protein [Nitrospina sp.]MBT4048354.1 glycosyltransferase family 4 protein [Nitrospina sp.]MBT4556482.1 glycosyltransferase family 4 protein [Nitrospina sp.]